MKYFDDLKQNVKKLPKMQDLKDLYQKVVPPLSNFEKSMAEYAAAHDKFEKILSHNDELLLQKASKIALEQLRMEMKNNYCSN